MFTVYRLKVKVKVYFYPFSYTTPSFSFLPKHRQQAFVIFLISTSNDPGCSLKCCLDFKKFKSSEKQVLCQVVVQYDSL